ncbi:ParB/RepB/Spo0J family partition protein [Lacrimispora sp. 38-1]|uniref:ParB/RepB/Spo0J family partition protein n=1 Tax=Lacrimispora sp. 38-1 TaxID=3125778 RepID=UPI003CF71198
MDQTKEEMNKNQQVTVIRNIKINELHDFEKHPFKVENDKELFELMRSIEEEGVLVPLLARPNPNGDGFEIIAGHRRKEASKWAGIDEVPVIIKELDDNQAIIAMVDSNLQRESIKPSEKAFAYKLKLDAMKRQGKRTDLSTDTFYPMDKKINSTEELGKLVGESQAQIARYVRLTNLLPEILDMVDMGQIAFRPAVEISFLKNEEQRELFEVMDLEQCTPTLSQAQKMKRMSQDGTLDVEQIYQIMEEEKPNQIEMIKIRADSLSKYFPKNFTVEQKIKLIEKLVKEWNMKCRSKKER